MQSVTNAQKQPWKDAAMEKAECITDIWEVVKAYMGRAAEWVLFLCMVINIIQMLPGVNIAGWVLNLVLGVQVVMLDIGGMSLASIAEHAKEKGAVANAKKADITSKFLIGLMITTLLLVASGVLFPAIKQYTDMAEKGLILVRVVMTVIYGHVIHSLRGSSHQAPVPATPAVPGNQELETLIKDILVPVLQQYRTETTADIAEQVKRVLPALIQQPGAKASQDVSAPDTPAEAPQLQSVALLSARRRQMDVSRPARDGDLQLNREARIASAYRELIQESIRPTGDNLSMRAHCNRAAALEWLKTKQLAG